MQANHAQIQAAASALMAGELVAFPTETVYGLGADAASLTAVAKIYTAKGRPSNHPVIVHVANAPDIQAWCRDIPPQAWDLANAFWPGPLTMILKRHPDVNAALSGGQDTIGVRCPSHPVAHAVLAAFADLKRAAGQCPVGVAAPSANRFGRVSPTQAAHVQSEFADLVAQGMPVLEGGNSEVGIESTIVDLSSVEQDGSVALLRPGAITADDIAKVLGCPVSGQTTHSPRVSGSLKAHYAPTTPISLCERVMIETALKRWLDTHEGRVALMIRESLPRALASDRIHVIQMPQTPTEYARDLYATLRLVDGLGVSAVLAEQVPDEAPWAGIRDRLGRAAAAFESDGNESAV